MSDPSQTIEAIQTVVRKLGRAGSVQRPRVSGRRRHIWMAAAAGGVVVGLIAALLLASSGAAAVPAGPPEVQRSVGTELQYLTSLHPPNLNLRPQGLETEWEIEISENETGPWALIPGCTGTIPQAEAEKAENFTRQCQNGEATGLKPETTYYLRFVARNKDGEAEEVTPEATTTRKPVMAGEGAVDVTGDAALLKATIYPQDSETSWRIEYSTSESSGWQVVGSGTISAVEAERFPRGQPEGPVFRTVYLTGLAAKTTYYVRVGAENTYGQAQASAEIGAPPPGITRFRTGGAPSASTFSTHSLDGESLRALGFVDPGASATDELQQVSVAAGSAGNIELCLESECTKPIVMIEEEDALMEAIERGLDALPALSDGGEYERAVSAGGGEAPGEIVLDFHSGPLAGRDVPQLSVDGSGLSAGAVSVSTIVNGAPLEVHYHFEYTPTSMFEASGFTGASSTPAVEGSGVVGEDLPEVKPGESYEFRLVASNNTPGDPVVYGASQRLSAPAALLAGGEGSCPNEALRNGPSAALPDCRAYEQITPPEKGGAQDAFKYGTKAEGTIVAEDGEALFLHAPGVAWGENPDVQRAAYTFKRGADGWNMSSVHPPGDYSGRTFQPFLFSGDLGFMGLEAGWETSLGVPSRQSAQIEMLLGASGGPYGLAASIPRGLVEGSGLTWVAMSADAGKLVLQSVDRKLDGTATGTTSGNDLYEYGEGALRQANVGAGKCGARIAHGFEGYEGRPLDSTGSPHAVSRDGGRVFFEAAPGNTCTAPMHVFVREDGGTPDAKTVDLGEGEFVAASADGERVLIQRQAGEDSQLFMHELESETVTPLLASKRPIFGNLASAAKIPVVSEDSTFALLES